jgi:hypothetical protein
MEPRASGCFVCKDKTGGVGLGWQNEPPLKTRQLAESEPREQMDAGRDGGYWHQSTG